MDIDSAVESIVSEKIKSIFGECSSSSNVKGVKGKRLLSERVDDSDSDSEDENPPPSQKKTKTQKLPAEPKTDYATQVVILEGIDEKLKKHPRQLSEAFIKTKPNVELRPDGLRITASGDVLVKPKNPKDCNALLKENAFPTTCALGKDIKARVPKAQQVTHQVVIKNVDVEVTQEEMDEVLTRQSLPYKSVKRIHSRQRDMPTRMFRLILKDEETKKKLLRDGINLDMMHYKCIPALEDTKTYPKVMQCFKCQKLGDHLVGSCQNEQKCVLCSGPHRKAECSVTKESYKCANCKGNHAAWSQECPHFREAVNAKKTPTIAQVASATVTPALLQQILTEVKESIVTLVTEVVSRSIIELVYDLHDKKVSKLGLPFKVASIASSAATAANKLKFGPATQPIEKVTLKQKVMKSCFPNEDLASTSTDGTSDAHSNMTSQNGSLQA